MSNKSMETGLVILVNLAVLFLSGCFSSDPNNIAAFKRPYEVDVSAETYKLMPPDEITIHCSRVPEIDGQTQRIRPDGIVSFEALGELQVAGKDPNEVAEALDDLVSGLYTLPGDKPIDVRISSFQHKKYYVIGQVMRYGPKLYTGRDSVFSALADARLNPMAWPTRIQVIRPSELEEVPPQIFEVSWRAMAVHGDLTKNILLEEGDYIYVPPTPFAWVALQIEQIMRPISRAFTGMYYLEATPTEIGRTTASRGGSSF